MDFFESQDRARQRTGLLIFFYGLAVILIVLAIYFVVLFLGGFAGMDSGRPGQLWDPELFLGVSAATVAIIAAGSLYRIVQLRSGGSRVAEMMGGRRVNAATTDLDERRLVNVVEEMALASGVPVPEIFVMENEEGINAFAAGYSPGDAAVAVTRGCLKVLNRDELQGVIAHEFSHILNGDMRLNIRLIGILNGILLLHLIGYMLVRSLRFTRVRSSRSGKGGGGAIVFLLVAGIALMIIGYIGVLCSRMIQAAVSRQREYLADAAAVQFTRNPGGIAGALKKIGGAARGSRVEASHAMEASHMFFANGIASSLSNIFATHPPLARRVQAIDPSFDGKSWVKPSPPRETKPPPSPKPEPRKARGPFDPITDSLPMKREVLLATIGTLGAEQISRAGQILELLPRDVKEAIREPAGAEAAVYCLLLSREPALQKEQTRLVRAGSPPEVAGEVERLSPSIVTLAPELRLPLVDLAVPALRQLSLAQFSRFREAAEKIATSDHELSLFEFALEKVIMRHLANHFSEKKRPATQYYSAAGVANEFSLLLSALARAGGRETEQAFAAGQSRLPDLNLRLEPRDRCTFEQIDGALNKLNLASYPVKKQFLDASIAVILADGKVAVEEGELLRGFADSLDCPMPPLG